MQRHNKYSVIPQFNTKAQYNVIPRRNVIPRIDRGIHFLLFGLFIFMPYACTSANSSSMNSSTNTQGQMDKTDHFPTQNDYPNDQLVDMRTKDTATVTVQVNKPVAFVVRDLAVTAFSNVTQPDYDINFAKFEGTEQCCQPTKFKMGGSGLLMYRFVFTKVGETKVGLIARRKGLDQNAEHLDSDVVKNIIVRIEANKK